MTKFLAIFLTITNIFAQNMKPITIDNLYAFGFANTFKWNMAIVNNNYKDEVLRMLIMKDINKASEKLISCSLKKLENMNFMDYLSKKDKLTLAEKIKNPYSRENTHLYIDKSDPNYLYAFIDHFGWVLSIRYVDKDGVNKQKFKEFIQSYVNVKVGL